MAKLSILWLTDDANSVEVTNEYRTGFLWRRKVHRVSRLSRSTRGYPWRFPNGDRADYRVPGTGLVSLEAELDRRADAYLRDSARSVHWTDVQILPPARVVEK